MFRFIKTVLEYLFLLGGALWLIGFLIFCGYTISLKYLPTEKTEAIIAWTGGNDRIAEAIRLLQEEQAPRLFISGVHESVTGYHLLKEIPENTQDKIELGYQAKTTHMNALETTDWVNKKGISSVTLVTSFYHMPRSMLELHRTMPKLKITPFAVFPKKFDEDTSWLHTRYAWLLFVEYHKFLIVYFLQGVSL